MSKKKDRIPYVTIILLAMLIGVAFGFSNLFLTKYILINSDWRAYQDLVDGVTENTDNLIDVNYSNLMSFIENDTGDSNPYSLTFVCTDFALALMHNASLQNISSGFVILNYHELEEHAVCVFNTTDAGIIYIEPQNDNDITEFIKILGVYGTSTIYSISVFFN